MKIEWFQEDKVQSLYEKIPEDAVSSDSMMNVSLFSVITGRCYSIIRCRCICLSFQETENAEQFW